MDHRLTHYHTDNLNNVESQKEGFTPIQVCSSVCLYALTIQKICIISLDVSLKCKHIQVIIYYVNIKINVKNILSNFSADMIFTL